MLKLFSPGKRTLGIDEIPRNPARSKALRRDVVTEVIQPHLEFDIYWKDTGDVGAGPTVAVYIYEKEVLRFDCFGPDKGHYHIFTDYEESHKNDRILWRESSRTDQISRTLWDLEKNLVTLIQLVPDVRIRRFQVDQSALQERLPVVRNHLETHLKLVEDHIANKNV